MSEAPDKPPAAKRKWRRGCLLFVILPLCVFLLIGACFPGAVWLYSYRDDTQKADAAIVLGAAVYDDKPSPVFVERIKHGIELYQTGVVKKLIFTGARDPNDKVGEAESARAMAIKAGVPAEDIDIEEQSRTTWGNLYYARPLLEKNKLDKVLIVSDPMHMRRAITMARDLGMDAYTSPTPTSLYKSRDSRLKFALDETLQYVNFLRLRIMGYPVRR